MEEKRTEEVKTFEGVCQGCGTIMSVLAASQEEADRLVSSRCGCGAAEVQKKYDQMISDLNECIGSPCTKHGFTEIEDETAAMIVDAADKVWEGKLEKITFVVDATTIDIKRKGDDKISISRKRIEAIKKVAEV